RSEVPSGSAWTRWSFQILSYSVCGLSVMAMVLKIRAWAPKGGEQRLGCAKPVDRHMARQEAPRHARTIAHPREIEGSAEAPAMLEGENRGFHGG
ncbi:MAG TPA: hypothetical protein VHE13_05970, partial [Opitutus sp.]|nr:hypothetical protein [Opitutus sp.]